MTSLRILVLDILQILSSAARGLGSIGTYPGGINGSSPETNRP